MTTGTIPTYPTFAIDARRVAALKCMGADFTVTWDAETGEEAASAKKCWVVLVQLGGVWFRAEDVMSSDMNDDLDAALAELEDFSECAA